MSKIIKCFLIAFFVIAGGLLFVSKTWAATVNYYVDPSGTDDGSHGTGTGTDAWATIQYAVTNVANPTTDTVIINVAAGIYTTGNDDIDIDRNFGDLTITGAGAGSTIVQPHADSSSATCGNFDIGSYEYVTLKNMTIRYGRVDSGSAINSSSSGALTVENVHIHDNDSASTASAIYTSSPITMTNTTVSNCDGGSTYGAMYVTAANSVVKNSTFYNNTGDNSGAINLSSSGVNFTIVNSTFYGNGGSFGQFMANNGSSGYIKNCFFAERTAGRDVYKGSSGAVYSGGYNIIESSNYTFSGTGDITGEQSSLNIVAGLSNNSTTNSVPTLGVTSGSIAIDAGDDADYNGVSIPSTDQRDLPRYGTTDIGAFEIQATDTVDPYFSAVSISVDDDYIDVTFNEGVYSTSGGTGGLASSDFSISVDTNNGNVSAATVTSVKKLDNSSPVGGETKLRLYISLTGTKRGDEDLTIYPADSTSIYDASGNPILSTTGSDSVTIGGYYEYYVDPTGTDDAEHGTASGASAWATIEYAINAVSNPTTVPIVIHIAAGTYDNNDDMIDIDRNFESLTLSGAGAETTIIQGYATYNTGTYPIMEIGGYENVILEDLTFENGRSGAYGGIRSDASDGSLTIRRCTIKDNVAINSGGSAALFITRGDFLMEDSTITNNVGAYVSGLYVTTSVDSAVVKNTTFYNNNGDIGTIYVNGSPITILNSIIAGEVNGSGIEFQGSVDPYIKNTIIIDNDDYDIEYYLFSGSIQAKNNIIGYEETEEGPFFVNGVNGNKVYTTTTTLADIYVSDTLADNSTVNGTQTLAITVDSPAVNSGDSDTYNSQTIPSLDQRGASVNYLKDIGPYEYNGVIGAPYVTEYYPAHGATGVEVDTNFALYFSENVDAEVGNIYLYKSDHTLVESFDVTSDISGSGTSIITVNPTDDLNEATDYYITINSTAFDDAESNSYSGIGASTTWTFTTEDNTAPTITSISSDTVAGSYKIGDVIDIDVTFSEAVTSTGNVTVTLETGETDRTCTFTVSNSTTGTCNYTVQSGDISSDLDATITGTIADQSSNSLSNYTPVTGLADNEALVVDGVLPTVETLSPVDDAEDATTTDSLTITFSEAVDAESGNITLFKSDDTSVEVFDVTSEVTGSGTTTITIDPTEDLEGGVSYYVLIASTTFDDLAGNSYAGISDSSAWSFTVVNSAGRRRIVSVAPTTQPENNDSNDSTEDSSDDSNDRSDDDSQSDSEDNSRSEDTSTDDDSQTSEGEGDSTEQDAQDNDVSDSPYEGLLIKYADDSAVYLIEGGEKKPIFSGEVFESLGYDWGSIETLGDDINFETGEMIGGEVEGNEGLSEWEGKLVKYQNDPAVYLIENKLKRPIFSAEVFEYFGYKWSDIIAIDVNIEFETGEMINLPASEMTFDRNLELGSVSKDVRSLQRYLNNNGFKLVESGPGSLNNETDYFGELTLNALIEFQKANDIFPAQGYFGELTREFINKK